MSKKNLLRRSGLRKYLVTPLMALTGLNHRHSIVENHFMTQIPTGPLAKLCDNSIALAKESNIKVDMMNWLISVS